MKSVIEETLAQAQANQRLFATRLVCLSKTGSKSPKVTDIRPIAVTTLPQKIIEHILLNKLKLELGNNQSFPVWISPWQRNSHAHS